MDEVVYMVIQRMDDTDEYFGGLHTFYDDMLHGGIIYYGYAEDESVAEEYCEQFRHNHDIFYMPTKMSFIKGLKQFKKIDVTPISSFVSDDKTVVIHLSEAEQMYCHEVLSETPDEFEDILNCIENLKRFHNNKKVRKTVKALEEIYALLRLDWSDTDEDATKKEEEFEEMIDNVDFARELKFVVDRIGLFDTRYTYKRNRNRR